MGRATSQDDKGEEYSVFKKGGHFQELGHRPPSGLLWSRFRWVCHLDVNLLQ